MITWNESALVPPAFEDRPIVTEQHLIGSRTATYVARNKGETQRAMIKEEAMFESGLPIGVVIR